MSHVSYLQLYFTIPNNLPCRQNTSPHGAGDSLWEGWVTNYLCNHRFDIGICIHLHISLHHSRYYILLIFWSCFDYGWWLCFTLRQSKWKLRKFTMPSMPSMEYLETKNIVLNRRLFITFLMLRNFVVRRTRTSCFYLLPVTC